MSTNEITCYHEAGHAVARYLLNRPFSLVCKEGVKTEGPIPPDKKLDEAVCCAAGVAAHAIQWDAPVVTLKHGGDEDYETAMNLFAEMGPEKAEEAWKEAIEEAIDLLESHWPMVDAVARRLIELPPNPDGYGELPILTWGDVSQIIAQV
jgi:hypothetical protein